MSNVCVKVLAVKYGGGPGCVWEVVAFILDRMYLLMGLVNGSCEAMVTNACRIRWFDVWWW